MPEEFQKNRWRRSPSLEVAQNSAVKLFWNFKNNLLSGRRSHQFEFSGQVNSMFANSESRNWLPIVLFFKGTFQHYKLLQTLLWRGMTCSSTFLKYPLAVLVQTPATYILMYYNASSIAFPAVRCFQFRKKVLGL